MLFKVAIVTIKNTSIANTPTVFEIRIYLFLNFRTFHGLDIADTA